jgi:hypothetical protein
MSRARIGRFTVALSLTLAGVGAAACTTFASSPTPDGAAPPIVRDAQVAAPIDDAAVDAIPRDGAVTADAAGDGATRRYFVFVTSQTIEGKFAGDAGPTTSADALCQEKGTALSLGSKWKAWLMADGAAPQLRIAEVPGGWYDTKGKLVASQILDLTVAMLANPPSFDEMGKLASGDVWTGVRGATCSEWTGRGQCDIGSVGDREKWSNASSDRSSIDKQHLYCFEQP